MISLVILLVLSCTDSLLVLEHGNLNQKELQKTIELWMQKIDRQQNMKYLFRGNSNVATISVSSSKTAIIPPKTISVVSGPAKSSKAALPMDSRTPPKIDSNAALTLYSSADKSHNFVTDVILRDYSQKSIHPATDHAYHYCPYNSWCTQMCRASPILAIKPKPQPNTLRIVSWNIHAFARICKKPNPNTNVLNRSPDWMINYLSGILPPPYLDLNHFSNKKQPDFDIVLLQEFSTYFEHVFRVFSETTNYNPLIEQSESLTYVHQRMAKQLSLTEYAMVNNFENDFARNEHRMRVRNPRLNIAGMNYNRQTLFLGEAIYSKKGIMKSDKHQTSTIAKAYALDEDLSRVNSIEQLRGQSSVISIRIDGRIAFQAKDESKDILLFNVHIYGGINGRDCQKVHNPREPQKNKASILKVQFKRLWDIVRYEMNEYKIESVVIMGDFGCEWKSDAFSDWHGLDVSQWLFPINKLDLTSFGKGTDLIFVSKGIEHQFHINNRGKTSLQSSVSYHTPIYLELIAK